MTDEFLTLNMKYVIYLLILVVTQNAFAEGANITISAACQQVGCARARGETFRTITANGVDTDNFFDVVRSGPFFDRYFKGSSSNHGVDMHLLQRDFLARNLPPEHAGKLNEMFNYMATAENGRKIWDEMFDSTYGYTLTSPEEVMLMIRPVLPFN